MRSNIFIIAILACLHAFSPLLRADEQETATKAEMAELRAQVQDLTKLVKDLQAQLAAKSEARPCAARRHRRVMPVRGPAA